MISLLYRDCLVFASAGKADQVYTIHAIIWLSEVRVEEADNGRGMQYSDSPTIRLKHILSFLVLFFFVINFQLFQKLIQLGLQCHTAPFSWKLVFQCDHQLYEIILTACSPKEELEWRSRLTERVSKEQNDIFEYALFTNFSLDIKPMGAIFGKPGKTTGVCLAKLTINICDLVKRIATGLMIF